MEELGNKLRAGSFVRKKNLKKRTKNQIQTPFQFFAWWRTVMGITRIEEPSHIFLVNGDWCLRPRNSSIYNIEENSESAVKILWWIACCVSGGLWES
jgi:hypothetical protein